MKGYIFSYEKIIFTVDKYTIIVYLCIGRCL
jgi:hypothetical protein